MGEHKAVIRRLFDDIWNGRRVGLIPELYTPDVVADYRPYALHTGWAGIESMVDSAYRRMPDYHEDLIDLVVEGDRAAVHLRISGTQSGPWGPVPPHGSPSRVRGDGVLHVRARWSGRAPAGDRRHDRRSPPGGRPPDARHVGGLCLQGQLRWSSHEPTATWTARVHGRLEL